MSTSSSQSVDIHFTEKEMQNFYRVLNLKSKLETGQAILEVRSTAPEFKTGRYGDEIKTQMLNIKIASNGHKICVAHRMIRKDGSPPTEPDPKFIHIDDLKLRKKKDGKKTRSTLARILEFLRVWRR